MKTKILFIRMFVLSCILFILGFTVGSCSDDDDAVLQAGYGYAQFKLYKGVSTGTRASTNELDYLRDAQKMKIVLINQEDGTEIVQTVGLEAMGDDSEFGLRSDKLQLMAGTYQIIGFYLYKADGTTQDLKQILSGEPDKKTILTVVNGGLAVQDIQVKVVNRGYNYVKNKWQESVGKAKFVGDRSVASLKVSFFGPFYAPYNVIALDENYQYALIVGKNTDYMWILAREKTIPENIKTQYLKIATDLGFDVSKLIWVKHE